MRAIVAVAAIVVGVTALAWFLLSAPDSSIAPQADLTPTETGVSPENTESGIVGPVSTVAAQGQDASSATWQIRVGPGVVVVGESPSQPARSVEVPLSIKYIGPSQPVPVVKLQLTVKWANGSWEPLQLWSATGENLGAVKMMVLSGDQRGEPIELASGESFPNVRYRFALDGDETPTEAAFVFNDVPAVTIEIH